MQNSVRLLYISAAPEREEGVFSVGCLLLDHDDMVARAPGRMWLRCGSGRRHSSGWTVGPGPNPVHQPSPRDGRRAFPFRPNTRTPHTSFHSRHIDDELGSLASIHRLQVEVINVWSSTHEPSSRRPRHGHPMWTHRTPCPTRTASGAYSATIRRLTRARSATSFPAGLPHASTRCEAGGLAALSRGHQGDHGQGRHQRTGMNRSSHTQDRVGRAWLGPGCRERSGCLRQCNEVQHGRRTM